MAENVRFSAVTEMETEPVDVVELFEAGVELLLLQAAAANRQATADTEANIPFPDIVFMCTSRQRRGSDRP
jgi:hypothetical protein